MLFNQWQGDPLADLKATVAQTAAPFLPGDDGQELSPQGAVAAIETLAHARRAEAKPTALAYGRDPDRISLDEYLKACAKATQRRLMVILDQFEEYSLYHPEGDAFAVEFPVAVVRADISVSFLISALSQNCQPHATRRMRR